MSLGGLPRESVSIAFCHDFFPWFDNEHRHVNLGLLTPEHVHLRQAPRILSVAHRRRASDAGEHVHLRQAPRILSAGAHVLDAAYAAHPPRSASATRLASLPRLRRLGFIRRSAFAVDGCLHVRVWRLLAYAASARGGLVAFPVSPRKVLKATSDCTSCCGVGMIRYQPSHHGALHDFIKDACVCRYSGVEVVCRVAFWDTVEVGSVTRTTHRWSPIR